MLKIVTRDGHKLNEKIPTFDYYGIHFMKFKPSKYVVKHITENMCTAKGNSTDPDDILKFINTYDVDWEHAIACKSDTLDQCVKRYRTLNDFFIRKIPVTVYQKTNDKILTSPATCRTTLFANCTNAKKFWVKGTEFNISNLLQQNKDRYFVHSNILISRLAPVDYHRFHSPVGGTFVKKIIIPGSYYSVNPMLVNSETNVFTENSRVVYYIDTVYFGTIAIVIVGATCVSSIFLHEKKQHESIEKGEELGYFKFGGSTLITIIPPNEKIVFDSRLLEHSREKTETYLNVGDYINVDYV